MKSNLPQNRVVVNIRERAEAAIRQGWPGVWPARGHFIHVRDVVIVICANRYKSRQQQVNALVEYLRQTTEAAAERDRTARTVQTMQYQKP